MKTPEQYEEENKLLVEALEELATEVEMSGALDSLDTTHLGPAHKKAHDALSTYQAQAAASVAKREAVIQAAIDSFECNSEIHDGKMCQCEINLEDAVEALEEEG